MPIRSELEAAKSAFHAGNLHLAEQCCRSHLRINPLDPEALDILGLILNRKGDIEGALNNIRNAISLDSNQASFHNHLGIILKQKGELDGAKEAYVAAISIEPKSPEATFNLALLSRQQGNLEEGLELSREAVNLDPGNDAAHNNLGAAYHELGLFEKAIVSFQQAIVLNPNHIGACSNLAAVLAEADMIEQALEVCNKALSKWPKSAELHNACSNAHARAQNWEEALAEADEAIVCNTKFAQAHYSKGLILLGLGMLKEGFKEFEWRTKRSNFWPQRRYIKPIWKGEPLTGKTLFVHWEQGFGDIIQFSRYLPLIRQTLLEPPDRLIFDCPYKLHALFADMCEVDEIGDFGDTPPEFDFYVPLMSLPMRLNSRMETIPAKIPYVTNRLDDHFKVLGGRDSRLQVGFVWASDHGTSYRRKVCPLKCLSNLFDVERAAFYGMQFGKDADDLNTYIDEKNVKNLALHLGDFAHTAAIIDQMDLIISIDTYIVHLAGAMGKPVWVMLPYVADWRWFLDRPDSPWYPSARLFRQSNPGDWPRLVTEVKEALIQYTANK